MKLYRVVPNIFSYEERLKCGTAPNAEAIYYKLGFASFIGSTVMNKGNNVFNQGEKIKMGKFFFLFPEDAIINGYTLLIGAQRLRFLESFYVLEYDFPEELIVKHFGYGDYSTNIPLYLMEIYIEKEDFITDENEICMGNVMDEKMFKSEKMTSLQNKLRSFNKYEKEKCANCFNNTLCRQCVAENYYINNNLLQVPEQTCEFAKQRTEMIIENLVKEQVSEQA